MSNLFEATHREKDAIAACVASHYGLSPDEAADLVNGAYIAVFDKYVPDCPGWVGRLAVVVWSGGPEMHATFAVEGPNWGPGFTARFISDTDGAATRSLATGKLRL